MNNFDRASLESQTPPASTNRFTKSRLSNRAIWVSAKWPLQRICLSSRPSKYTINAEAGAFLTLLTTPLDHLKLSVITPVTTASKSVFLYHSITLATRLSKSIIAGTVPILLISFSVCFFIKALLFYSFRSVCGSFI